MYKVESDFIFNGLRCVVLFTRGYSRSGYVGVPNDHKFFGKEHESILQKFDVYGGLTFQSNFEGEQYPVSSELWWFGFDAGSLKDGIDIKTAIEYFPEIKEEIENYGKDREERTKLPIKTKEFMEDECRKLANQLSNI